MRLDEEMRSMIQKDAVKRLKTRRIDKKVNLHLHHEILDKGTTLKAVKLSVPVDRKSVLVFADLAPQYNWAHPCEYHLYDAQNGSLYKTVKASLPPMGMALDEKTATAFHLPVDISAPRKKGISASKKKAVSFNAMSNSPGERYAILFAGKAEARHTNDLEFLYRTLIDVYGFDPAHIQVLNHDGTVNYFLGNNTSQTIGANLGNWPGNHTPYRLVVNQPGTRAGFQAALNAIGGQIRPEDLLFIHTNNHGGGPCDPGINDYCIFVYDANGTNWVPYYINEFIADMGILPQCEVLMVMMEQCRSGGFIDPIINNSPATWTHVTTAVTADDYSLGDHDNDGFDHFAKHWIAGISGHNPDGTALGTAVDTTNDGRISATEAFNYANALRFLNGGVFRTCPPPSNKPLRLGDTPTAGNSPAGYGDYIFLGLPAHDLYLRDNLQDHGREPLINGGISCSPDIIVFRNKLIDPDATLGTPAAQNSDTLSEDVEVGQDNYIYLRVQNRGSQPTSGSARLFWALPSVLPTPNSWTEITDPLSPEPIGTVSPGEMRIVGPITWEKKDIPPIPPGQVKGHYCFIGLINSGDDPAPDPATIQTPDDYYNFIRASNNATWKNFDTDNKFANSIASIEFAIQGWPKIKLSADLAIDLSNLPQYMTAKLRILKRLSSTAKTENATLITESSLYQKFELLPEKRAFLRGMNLKTSDKCQVYLDITIPDNAKDGNYRLSVAQLVDGKEMGRVTRMLAVGDYPYMANRRTLEVHVPDCEWAAKTSGRNKVAYDSIERALKHGYNGCAYCLPEYNTG